MMVASVLQERDFTPWLENKKASIDPYYWGRYRELLAEKHFSGQVISMLDDVTDRILGLMENPDKNGNWDRRGMVVGHVQSGKTANYTGLICKAADAGYKIIIVIAGIHNRLRNQTQQRIDEGFVGRDSARLLSNNNDKIIGVGRFDVTRRPITFTNSFRDFNKVMATGIGIPLQGLSEPAVFVIKKNYCTLNNLIEWLSEHSVKHGTTTIDSPMLLIDDEADTASINVNYGRGEVTRINGQIRDLLRMFQRSCYIGYTATPFANIFIDPDSDDEMLGADLFPRHFIVSLDSPSNYLGANRIFIEDASKIIRHIDDNEDTLPLHHSIDKKIVTLPESLVMATRTFIIARAIRLARGQKTSHCSMLVNASRFTGVQKQIRDCIHEKLGCIGKSVRINGCLTEADALKDKEIAALYNVWRDVYPSSEFGWGTIQKILFDAIAPISVVEVNNKSAGKLNYDDYEKTGLNVIVVGGYSLSRGLTLEGLMVSYFLRNSMMYDTLMQMGRWFGYRPGYEDLCRIWMPEEAEGWYYHITESIEMLRDELRRMEAANATPAEFGLKVRSHPDNLIVTARNKMGSSGKVVVRIGLSNSFVETALLKRDDNSLTKNRLAARRFVENLAESGRSSSSFKANKRGWLFKNAPVDPIKKFISEFVNHPGSMLTDNGPVIKYIEDRQNIELHKWDVLLTSTLQAKVDTLIDESLGLKINCRARTSGQKSDKDTLRITNKQRVASRGDEQVGLSQKEIDNAELGYCQNEGKDVSSKKINYPDWIYRTERKNPLLIIHLLKLIDNSGACISDKPVVAWSISFPRTEVKETRVEFIVTKTWMRENFFNDNDIDEIEDNDDE